MGSDVRSLKNFLQSELPKLTIPEGVKIEISTERENKGKCPPPYIHLQSNGNEGFIRGNTVMVLLEDEPSYMHVAQFPLEGMPLALQESINFISKLRVIRPLLSDS